jgi:hypothetical protein
MTTIWRKNRGADQKHVNAIPLDKQNPAGTIRLRFSNQVASWLRSHFCFGITAVYRCE